MRLCHSRIGFRNNFEGVSLSDNEQNVIPLDLSVALACSVTQLLHSENVLWLTNTDCFVAYKDRPETPKKLGKEENYILFR